MAMTDNPRPYRNGPGGHRDAAADIAKMLAKGDKKKAKKKVEGYISLNPKRLQKTTGTT